MNRWILIIAIVLTQAHIAYSQASDYPTIEQEVSHEEIKELSQELDLRKTEKAWRPKNTPTKTDRDYEYKPNSSPGLFGSLIGNLFYYLLILMAIVLVIAILIFFFYSIEDDRKVGITDIVEEEESEIKDIKELDLKEMLKTALDNRNYRMAIRAKFLIVLQQLAIRKDIDWSQEKTNRDYSRALRSTPFHSDFNNVAIIYERVWYGEVAVDQDIYKESEKAFDAFDILFKEQNALV